MGKRLLLQPRGPPAAAGRRRRAGQHGQGDAGPEGPQRRARAARPGAPTITNDGVSIAREIELSDQFKNMGAQLVREVANKTSRPHRRRHDDRDAAGPGDRARGHARARRGRQPDAPAARHRGGDRVPRRRAAARSRGPSRAASSSPTSRRSPPRRTRSSATPSPTRSIASAPRASSRSRSPTSPASRVDFVEGMHVENGWVSPYMVRDRERMETVFEDPYILMTNKPISHPQRPAARRSTQVMKAPRPLVILAEKVDGSALGMLVANNQHRTLRGRRGARARLRPPAHPPPRRPRRLHRRPGDRRGGRADARPRAGASHFGRARRVIVTADSTTFIEGAGTREARRGAAVRDPRRARARDRTTATSRSSRSASRAWRSRSP